MTPTDEGPSRGRPPHIGIVVQRFGEQIVGGAEAHARMVALALAPRARVTVITSCATETETWTNRLPAGTERDGPLTVRRLAASLPRFGRLHKAVEVSVRRGFGDARPLGRLFATLQGPVLPGLSDAITGGGFDRLILFTYLYAPTITAARVCRGRALPFDFVPTAHDEPALRFTAMQESFRFASRIAFNTDAEADLVRRRVPGLRAPSQVVGCGTDRPEVLPKGPLSTGQTLPAQYVLYLGRDKPGVELLTGVTRGPVPLVTGGAVTVPGALNLGRVSSDDKWRLLSGALAIVQPSRYESLGLTLIEAWQCGRPVVVTRACDVLSTQVALSGGGLIADDGPSLATAVARLADSPTDAATLGAAGGVFAERYTWPTIADYFLAPFARGETP
ncbi:MAG: glycosyltransferase family 4 protein [Myxococcales bacterium]|nr:glycosyltransferase family 4 protein [Myxococcales bacterium]